METPKEPNKEANKPIGNLPPSRAPKLTLGGFSQDEPEKQQHRAPNITTPSPTPPEETPRRRRSSSRHSRADQAHRRESRSSRRRHSGINKLALTAGFLMLTVVLVIGSYLLGKQQGELRAGGGPQDSAATRQTFSKAVDSKPTAAKSVDTASFSEISKLLDASFRAFQQGDTDEALEHALKLQELAPDFPGIHYHIARIKHRQGNMVEAMSELDTSIARGEELSDTNILKAQIFVFQKVYESAYTTFAVSAREDPYRPYAYFYWGEALREEGKAREAVTKLEQAFIRASEQPDAFVIRLKLLLARVEADDTEFVETELRPQLEKANPAGEWLMAAAALALRNNETTQASEYLKRARASLQPAFYWFLAQDKFFDLYRINPALAEDLGAAR